MSDLNYLPISCLDYTRLSPLMKEEERSWLHDLEWDYSPVRQILASLMNQKLLPGYVALLEQQAAGYTYFLMNRAKGVIGSVYVRRTDRSQEIADELLSLTISNLKDSPRIRRVEAQIMPFNGLDISESFSRNGFHHFSRLYLSLDLKELSGHVNADSKIRILPWDSGDLDTSARIIFESYKNKPDAEICLDYRSIAGCENYIRSIIQNPGCGDFQPETSFMALDERGNACGLVVGCRISDGVGMIPQIAVHPYWQSQSFGNALMLTCLKKYKSLGFRKISLTVTPRNHHAYEWYRRLGFKTEKEFGAYSWERQSV